MRFLETVLNLGLVMWYLVDHRALFRGDSLVLLSFLVFNFIIFVIHSKFEKLRWQMFLSYVALIVNVIQYNLGYATKTEVPINIMFVIISTCLSLLFPIPSVPVPPFATNYVGSKWHHLYPQKKRRDNEKVSHKETLMKIWYPVDREYVHDKSVKKELDSWFFATRAFTASAKVSMHLSVPNWMFSFFSLAKTNSYKDAPISNKNASYPVLIFSHGLTGIPEVYTSFCEGMAAQGYVVVGIWHTDGSSSISPLLMLSEGIKVDGCLLLDDDESKYVHFAPLPKGLKSAQEQEFYRSQLSQRVHDVSFVVEQLKVLNKGENKGSPFFKGKLDLDRIGIFGHSFGGTTSFASCLDIPAVKCGVALDSWLFPISVGPYLDPDSRYHVVKSIDHTRTFMYINSSLWQTPANLELIKNSLTLLSRDHTGVGYNITVEDTAHQNFCDIPFLLPIVCSMISPFTPYFTGKTDSVKVLRIAITLMAIYFDRHLNEKKTKRLTENDLNITGINLEIFS